jgi:UPF0755 protein
MDLKFRAGRRGAAEAARSRKRSRWAQLAHDLAVVCVTTLVVFGALMQMLSFLTTREIGERVMVEIPPGAGLREIAGILKDAGLVDDTTKFVMAARVLRFSGSLQAGSYEFGPEFSELEVLLALKYGEVAARHITIPEGYRAAEIAALLEGVLGIKAEEFMSLVSDQEFMAELGVLAPSLEGYLHPDTYSVRLGMTAADVARMMVAQTNTILNERRAARAESLGMTELDVLTLASIIEAEAAVEGERSRISAVYHNRLREGWKLEADPTVRYAIGNFDRTLSFNNLEVDSPYNTYRHAGFPPGPICNPGVASIDAALRPERGCEDFFFVSNGDGTHTFSKTFAEHTEAIHRIAREREQREFSLDTGGSG